MRLPALPNVPILLLFNGDDEEFPARCAMLLVIDEEKGCPSAWYWYRRR